VAVLPLLRERLRWGGLRLRVVALAGCDHTLTAASLALDAASGREVVDLLLRRLGQGEPWDVLWLGPLRCEADLLESLAEACATHPEAARAILGRRDGCAMSFDLPASYGEYLAQLTSAERGNIARCGRRLQEHYAVQEEIPQTPEEIAAALEEAIALHQRVWTHKGQYGQFVDWPGLAGYTRELTAVLAAAGRVQMVRLAVAQRTLGVECGYLFAGRVHALFRGYCDEAPWRDFSLGRMLHCAMVREAIRRGATQLDDGRGAFEYKRRLGARLECVRSLTVLHRGVGAALRFGIARRGCYLYHVLYRRVWFDGLRHRLGLAPTALRAGYIRASFMAGLQRHLQIARCVAPRLWVTGCRHPAPWCGVAGVNGAVASAEEARA